MPGFREHPGNLPIAIGPSRLQLLSLKAGPPGMRRPRVYRPGLTSFIRVPARKTSVEKRILLLRIYGTTQVRCAKQVA